MSSSSLLLPSSLDEEYSAAFKNELTLSFPLAKEPGLWVKKTLLIFFFFSHGKTHRQTARAVFYCPSKYSSCHFHTRKALLGSWCFGWSFTSGYLVQRLAGPCRSTGCTCAERVQAPWGWTGNTTTARAHTRAAVRHPSPTGPKGLPHHWQWPKHKVFFKPPVPDKPGGVEDSSKLQLPHAPCSASPGAT